MNIELMQELIYPIVGVLHDVRTELGPGLNESVYQEGLELELQAQNIPYEREKTINPTYRGIAMEAIFRMDFVCVKNIIVECKAVNKLNADHFADGFLGKLEGNYQDDEGNDHHQIGDQVGTELFRHIGEFCSSIYGN